MIIKLAALIAAAVTATTLATVAAEDRAACRAIVTQMYQAQDYTGTAIERQYVGLEDDDRVAVIFDAVFNGKPLGPVLDRVCGR